MWRRRVAKVEVDSRGTRARVGALETQVTAGSVIREKAVEQEKSLRDYLYTLFEEAASEAGLFANGANLNKAEMWTEPHRNNIKGGQLLRITAPTRILDAQHFNERLKAAVDLASALAGVMITEDQVKLNEKQRDAAFRVAGETMIGGKRLTQQMLSMGRFVDNFFGGQLMMRQFPCGIQHPEYNFVGILSRAPGLLQDDPDALYAKYGYGLNDWTVVSQVANVPAEAPKLDADALNVDFMNGSQIQRNRFEEFIDRFMAFMQQLGFSAAARFPEISVQPLAIYHRIDVEQYDE
jgi:hypothetical protein